VREGRRDGRHPWAGHSRAHQGQARGRGRRSLGRRELKPFRDLDDGRPQTEIARKLYWQATNKIARVSDEAAAFLSAHF
jgi:hypothetical protein